LKKMRKKNASSGGGQVRHRDYLHDRKEFVVWFFHKLAASRKSWKKKKLGR